MISPFPSWNHALHVSPVLWLKLLVLVADRVASPWHVVPGSSTALMPADSRTENGDAESPAAQVSWRLNTSWSFLSCVLSCPLFGAKVHIVLLCFVVVECFGHLVISILVRSKKGFFRLVQPRFPSFGMPALVARVLRPRRDILKQETTQWISAAWLLNAVARPWFARTVAWPKFGWELVITYSMILHHHEFHWKCCVRRWEIWNDVFTVELCISLHCTDLYNIIVKLSLSIHILACSITYLLLLHMHETHLSPWFSL